MTVSAPFKVLADRNRLRILAALLRHDELCVCHLTRLLGVAGATASRHLAQLQEAGFLRSRKEGRWVHYRLSGDMPHGFPVDWLRNYLMAHEDIAGDAAHLQTLLAEGTKSCDGRPKKGAAESRVREKKVLFLCTGNSCRSQMAEGWANHLCRGRLKASSAGIEVKGVDPRAAEVMREAGIDLSSHRSQHLDEFDLTSFDVIITLCDDASDNCPMVPPPCRVLHQGFDDPPRLARNLPSEEAKLQCYRRVRDQIQAYVHSLPEILDHGGKEE